MSDVLQLLTPSYTINIGGAIIVKETLDCDVMVMMNTSFEPDSFVIKVYNVDQVTQQFIQKNTIVTLALGYESGLSAKLTTERL